MITDFTTYRFSDKAIRVRFDAEKGIFLFVVVDALALVLSNPEVFWTKQKKQFSTSTNNSSDYYTTVNTNNGAVDVADLHQIEAILKTIPNRKNKKERLLNWINNPIPTKITEMVSIALSDGVMTETERNNIIDKSGKAGISTELINRYINDAIVQCRHAMTQKSNSKSQTKTYEFTINKETNRIEVNEKKEPSNDGCLLLFAISFIELLLMISGGISIVVFMILILVQFFAYGLIIEKKYPDIANNKSFYKYNTTPYYKKTKTSYTKPAIPQSIREWIRAALKNNILSFAKRREIVNEAVESGADRMLINLEINTAIRKRLQSFKRDKLTICKRCAELIPNDIGQCPFCGKEDIWHKINSLTRLALADRVLTDLERETIVNKAVEGGISKEEINQYLDDQLNLRLKSYTKVDLRDCPFCGAQIPLISDECMYCGKPLEHIEGSTNIAFNISGKEADIIRSENQRVEQERHGITNCPDCGAPFPLISNICESCGHVLHERTENALNIKNLLTNMQRSIDRVNKAPKPTVLQIIMYWFYYILMILSIFAFIVGIIADNEVGKIISLAGFIGGIIAMGTNAVLNDTKSPVLIADGEYYKAKHSYEMFAREVDTLYGDDDEAQKMLSNFSSTLKLLKRERYQNRIKVGRIILITALVILGVVTYFSVKAEDYTQPHKENKEITIPPNTEWALNFSKHLEPYPPESGVQDNLSDFLRANKGAELSFVMGEDNNQPVFHWKVAQLELLPGESADTNHIFKNVEIGIQLLDSNYQQIKTLSICLASRMPYHNYNTIIDKGKGHYYIDFWSKNYTSEESILYTISEKAVYYTIYYNTKPSNY